MEEKKALIAAPLIHKKVIVNFAVILNDEDVYGGIDKLRRQNKNNSVPRLRDYDEERSNILRQC